MEDSNQQDYFEIAISHQVSESENQNDVSLKKEQIELKNEGEKKEALPDNTDPKIPKEFSDFSLKNYIQTGSYLHEQFCLFLKANQEFIKLDLCLNCWCFLNITMAYEHKYKDNHEIITAQDINFELLMKLAKQKTKLFSDNIYESPIIKVINIIYYQIYVQIKRGMKVIKEIVQKYIVPNSFQQKCIPLNIINFTNFCKLITQNLQINSYVKNVESFQHLNKRSIFSNNFYLNKRNHDQQHPGCEIIIPLNISSFKLFKQIAREAGKFINKQFFICPANNSWQEKVGENEQLNNKSKSKNQIKIEYNDDNIVKKIKKIETKTEQPQQDKMNSNDSPPDFKQNIDKAIKILMEKYDRNEQINEKLVESLKDMKKEAHHLIEEVFELRKQFLEIASKVEKLLQNILQVSQNKTVVEN